MASVWVPFTSEAKEAIAHYDDIVKEAKLALQEAGRTLAKYTSKKNKMQSQLARANLFERYIPEVAHSLARLAVTDEKKLREQLEAMTKKADIQEAIHGLKATNEEYDEDFASIGKDEESEEDSEDGDEKPKKAAKKPASKEGKPAKKADDESDDEPEAKHKATKQKKLTE
jgi:DNA topoisomerase-6 subunit B